MKKSKKGTGYGSAAGSTYGTTSAKAKRPPTPFKKR